MRHTPRCKETLHCFLFLWHDVLHCLEIPPNLLGKLLIYLLLLQECSLEQLPQLLQCIVQFNTFRVVSFDFFFLLKSEGLWLWFVQRLKRITKTFNIMHVYEFPLFLSDFPELLWTCCGTGESNRFISCTGKQSWIQLDTPENSQHGGYLGGSRTLSFSQEQPDTAES